MLGLLLLLQVIPDARLARAEIVFDARASVADFQGKTQDATGAVVGSDSLRGVRGWVEVRWRDIDTGNRARNRHMLVTVEDSAYPAIRFELREVDTLRAVVRGEMTLHGVTRQVEWPMALRLGGDTLQATADFPLDIRDYGIKPPVRFVIARMGAVVRVRVRLVFVSNGE